MSELWRAPRGQSGTFGFEESTVHPTPPSTLLSWRQRKTLLNVLCLRIRRAEIKGSGRQALRGILALGDTRALHPHVNCPALLADPSLTRPPLWTCGLSYRL
ncbi:hypothetical protein DPEC_G00231310 [Dallia pectoralis]|uniref:Uncharacterized protein n=1 Tax=Dallia pectoralis TaxID=75939 RepID=A0ACC2FX68_DALPE|nr:hypothetical protein DPEC_G00231310 [Dallia pectoralis]